MWRVKGISWVFSQLKVKSINTSGLMVAIQNSFSPSLLKSCLHVSLNVFFLMSIQCLLGGTLETNSLCLRTKKQNSPTSFTPIVNNYRNTMFNKQVRKMALMAVKKRMNGWWIWTDPSLVFMLSYANWLWHPIYLLISLHLRNWQRKDVTSQWPLTIKKRK